MAEQIKECREQEEAFYAQAYEGFTKAVSTETVSYTHLVPSCDQVHVHASVRKNQQKQILENFHYWNAFLFVGIGCFQS